MNETRHPRFGAVASTFVDAPCLRLSTSIARTIYAFMTFTVDKNIFATARKTNL